MSTPFYTKDTLYKLLIKEAFAPINRGKMYIPRMMDTIIMKDELTRQRKALRK